MTKAIWKTDGLLSLELYDSCGVPFAFYSNFYGGNIVVLFATHVVIMSFRADVGGAYRSKGKVVCCTK